MTKSKYYLFKIKAQEFPLWFSGNEPYQYPRGHGFDPWPCSAGQESGTAVSVGVGCRRGLDPVLLWLWGRLAAAAPTGPLDWEPPYATGAALEKTKRQNKIK